MKTYISDTAYSYISESSRSRLVKFFFKSFLFLLTLLGAGVRAEMESEEHFFSDIPSVISATRIQQKITETPASVTVIDRAMIEASGAIEIPELLRLVPGMQISYAQGNHIAATAHGFSDDYPKRLQVLVDGRSVFQPSLTNVDWNFIGINIEDIALIEVVRGPNSPFYGANSVQGVINIITFQPAQVSGGYAAYTGGEASTSSGFLRHASRWKNLDYRLSASYRGDDGLPGDFDSTNDGKSISALHFRGLWQLGSRDEIDMHASYDSGDLGAGIQISDDPPSHDKEVQQSSLGMNWRRSFRNGADSQLHVFYNAYKSEDGFRQRLSQAVSLDPKIIALLYPNYGDQEISFSGHTYQGKRYEVEWKYTSQQQGSLRYMLGLSAREDRFKSQHLTDNSGWLGDSIQRGFVNVDFRPTERLIFAAGLMADHSNLHGVTDSPRLSVNYLLSPNHSLRASYTRGSRNPSLLEYFYDRKLRFDDGTAFYQAALSRTPKAETNTSHEIGFIGYWWDQRLFVDAKLFVEEIDDTIHQMIGPVTQPLNGFTDDIEQVDNGGSIRLEGFESQIKFNWSPETFVSLQYAYTDVADITILREAGDTEPWSDAEASVPEHTLSVLASHRLDNGWEFSLGFYHVSDMSWLLNGDGIPSHNRWDLRIAKAWQFDRTRAKLEWIMHNLGDDHFSFRDENVFETRHYLRASLGF